MANNVKVILYDKDNNLEIDVDVLIGVYNKIKLKKEDKIKETASNLNSEEIIKLMKDLYYLETSVSK